MYVPFFGNCCELCSAGPIWPLFGPNIEAFWYWLPLMTELPPPNPPDEFVIGAEYIQQTDRL